MGKLTHRLGWRRSSSRARAVGLALPLLWALTLALGGRQGACLPGERPTNNQITAKQATPSSHQLLLVLSSSRLMISEVPTHNQASREIGPTTTHQTTTNRPRNDARPCPSLGSLGAITKLLPKIDTAAVHGSRDKRKRTMKKKNRNKIKISKKNIPDDSTKLTFPKHGNLGKPVPPECFPVSSSVVLSQDSFDRVHVHRRARRRVSPRGATLPRSRWGRYGKPDRWLPIVPHPIGTTYQEVKSYILFKAAALYCQQKESCSLVYSVECRESTPRKEQKKRYTKRIVYS